MSSTEAAIENLANRHHLTLADARRLWGEAKSKGDSYIDFYLDPLVKEHLASIPHELN